MNKHQSGQWLRVDAPNKAPTEKAYIGFSIDINSQPTEWIPAFVEAGQLLVRVPNVQGTFQVWVKLSGMVSKRGIIQIQ